MAARRWLTTRDVATLCHMSTFTVLRWIKYGGLAAIQPSRKYLIREDVLDAWLARGPSRPMPDKADSNLIDLARAFRKREK